MEEMQEKLRYLNGRNAMKIKIFKWKKCMKIKISTNLSWSNPQI